MSDGGSAPAGARIAGFWRRLAAAIVDWVALGVPAYVVAYLFFDQLAALGQEGRVFGAALSLGYFGFLNSNLGGGQTLGKRLLGIRVVGASGAPIGLPRAMLRWLVLALPFYLNGVDLSRYVEGDRAFMQTGIGALTLLAVFGFGMAHAYLYVFNRKTRQSLHDLFAESYVVRVGSGEVTARVWPVHVAIAVALLTVSAVLPAFVQQLSRTIASDETFAAMNAIAEDIEKDPRVLEASVSSQSGTAWSSGDSDKTTTTSELLVSVQVPKRSDDVAPILLDVGRVVLRHAPDLLGNEKLTVSIVVGFDVGLVSGTESHTETGTAEEWQRAVDGQGTKTLIVRRETNDTLSAYLDEGRAMLRYVLPEK